MALKGADPFMVVHGTRQFTEMNDYCWWLSVKMAENIKAYSENDCYNEAYRQIHDTSFILPDGILL